METTPLNPIPDWLHDKSETAQESTPFETNEEPGWLKEDKIEDTKSELDKSKVRSASGKKPRRSKGRGGIKRESNTGNESASVGDYEEDCCCIPMDMIDPLLWWIWLFRLVCIVLLSASLGANFYYISSTTRKPSSYTEIREYLIHFYALLFCIAGIAAEMELKCMKHYIRVLQQWFFRGLFYAFIGILTSFFSSTASSSGSNRPTWTNVVSLLLVLMGALYSIMGLLCVKSRLAKSHAYSEIVETVGSGEEV